MRHPLSRAIAQVLRPHAAALFSVALVPSLVLAQEADRPKELDAVVVSAPIVSSQSQSIELKREAIGVVDAIASDTIGDFPDQTAAAALSRLPAVAVQRDQGQERYIQVRGAPSRWTAVAFDDINVVGADERIFRFDSVPAGLIDVVTVNKTLTPSMPSEALAGRVNIETVSPMSKRGFNGQVGLGYGPMELGDGKQRQGDARLSWSNDTFGILIGGSTYSRDQLTDNREFDYDEDGVPTMFDFRSYQLERETNSGMLKLEWRPAEGHSLGLNSLYTEFKDHEYRNQYIFDLGGALGGQAGIDSGSLVGVPVNAMLQDGNYANSVWTTTLSGDHALDTWTLGWGLNFTRTEGTTNLPLIRQIQTSPTQFVSLDYDRRNPNLPVLDLYTTVMGDAGFARGTAVRDLNQADFGMDLLIPIDITTEADAVTFKFDASRDLSIADGARLSLGAQIDRREAKGNTFGSTAVVPVSAYAAALGLPWDLDPFVTGKQWISRFPRGFGVNYVDNAGARKLLDQTVARLQAAGLYDPAAAIDPTSSFELDEDIQAAYAQLEVQSGAHQFLAGVRVERASLESRGNLVDAGGTRVPVTIEHDRTDVFPSVHWNIDLGENLKLRNALVTGMARPGFADLRASVSVNDIDGVIAGGNPGLEPERAWGYDGSLEWYFAEASIAAINVFYRDVSDVLFSSTSTVADDRYDAAGISRRGYDYVTTLNGGDGKLTGVELSYQQPFKFLPGWMDGFGVQLNLAYIDGEFEAADGSKHDFKGTSKQVLNASLYYEKHGLSARLAYQWRDKWLDDVSLDGGANTYWDATEQLDLSVRYAINEKMNLFFDANNLTNEQGLRYEGDKSRPLEVEGFGRRYMAGLRLRF
ncbi:TonB-dependent receptor [Pseudoxanthomonas putridarboris]|uniref:TonB-dependent receptor n=1 Tax=Pseudoxanthomonas putridarboris TaxID=752605 RepID=A0ABU9J1J5_9GAMM